MYTSRLFSSFCKKIRILSLVALCALPQTLFSQQTITIEENKLPASQVIARIEQQTGCSFAYNRTQFDPNREVSLSLQNATLETALTQLLAGSDHTYTIKGTHIILTPQTPARPGGAGVSASPSAQPAKPAAPPARPAALPVKPAAQPARPAASPASQSAQSAKPAASPAAATPAPESTSEPTSEPTPAPAAEIAAASAVVSSIDLPAAALPRTEAAQTARTQIPASTAPVNPFEGIYDPLTTPSLKRYGPYVGVKTNVLYWATTTPNLSVEVALGMKTTLDVTMGWNPFTFADNKKIKQAIVKPELRLWTHEKFTGGFFGFHAMYGQYNMGNVDLPLDVFPGLADSRYRGWFVGGGVSYGHQWYLGPHWNLEATFGFGYAYSEYRQYQCQECGEFQGRGYKHYFGPTKLGVSFIYLFGSKK